jgi:ATP-dependent Clp protease adaptor protein ClpS
VDGVNGGTFYSAARHFASETAAAGPARSSRARAPATAAACRRVTFGGRHRKICARNLRRAPRSNSARPALFDMAEESHHSDQGLAVQEVRPRLKKPPLFKVVLLNDDYTPMEFVVEILERIFSMERTKATQVMLEVHTRGKGVCGVYTYEIAETKVAQVNGYAQKHQHPLLCTMEEI